MSTKAYAPTNLLPLAADPAAGRTGDSYLNTTTRKVRAYTGTGWVDASVPLTVTDGAAGTTIYAGATAPSSPAVGDLWVDGTSSGAGAVDAQYAITLAMIHGVV